MSDGSELTLELHSVLPAPRAAVYRACTTADEVARWFGPHGFTVPHIALDLRVGGRYRFTMQPPEGDVFHLTGEFREIDPRTRLVYTFVYEEPDPDDRETLVSVSLADRRDASELALVQTGFATRARVELHRAGWTDSLERLEEVLSAPGAAPG